MDETTAQFRWRGLAISYRRFGAGQPMLLLHAMSVSGPYWRQIIDALTGRYEFIIPDLPFHGDSDDLPDPASHRHEDNADMLHAFITTLLGDSVHLVGHSYGGASGVTFTLRHAELVRRVVLIEPSLPTVLLEGSTPELARAQIEMNRVFEHHVEAGDASATPGARYFTNRFE